MNSLWTLEPTGQPGLARTTADLGIESVVLTRTDQAAATLSLSLAGDFVETDLSPWGWERRWTLRRGGSIVFRGRVTSPPDLDAADESETMTVELSDAWADLAETTYMQEWDSLTATGAAKVAYPRASLGWRGPSNTPETTVQALGKVVDAATRYGVPMTLNARLPNLICPTIEAGNQSCADLIRAVLRYHPGATATVVSTEGGDVLMVCDRSLANPLALPAIGSPVAGVRLRPRPDLAKSSVHVYYSASATHWSEGPKEGDEEPGLVARKRLAVFSDVYPPGSQPDRRSMVVELPAGDVGGGGGGGGDSPPPMPHAVPVKTRPLPKTGANDKAAEKFWLDLLGLTALGITVNDVVLPPPDSEAAQPHRVRFAWAVDDEDDPLQGMPSAINPKAKPLWRPPSVDNLPRMLVGGQLAEWMRVKAAEVIVDATVGVKKSAVDALDELGKKAFMRLSPELGKVGGVDAYRIYQPRRVVATTAKTKVYYNWAATAAGNPSESLKASIDEARKRAVIPDLARQLYEERSTVPWEGSVTLVEEECGSRRYLQDRVINLTGGRPEWTDMRAVVQGETLDIATGTTTLKLGPPQHLSPQDHEELYMTARRAHAARAEAAQTLPPPASNDGEDDGQETGRGGVFPPTVVPVREAALPGGGSALYTPGFWVSAGTEGKVTVAPSVVGGMGATSAMPVVGGTPLTAAPLVTVAGTGTVIALKIESKPDTHNTGTEGEPRYVITDGGGTLVGQVEVVTFASLAAMNAASRVALINNANGTVTQNGKYHLPLAMVMEGGGVLQVGHIGPIGVRMCSAGSLVVSSPALQIVAVDDKGNIVKPPAP